MTHPSARVPAPQPGPVSNRRRLARLVVVPLALMTPLLALPLGASAEGDSTEGSSPSSNVGAELMAKLDKVIGKLERSLVAADVRDGLLARLRSMRDAIASGQTIGEGDVAALVSEVKAAIEAAARPTSTEPSVPESPPSSTGTRPGHEGDEDDDDHGGDDESDDDENDDDEDGDDEDGDDDDRDHDDDESSDGTKVPRPGPSVDISKVTKQLDEWAAKISSSSMSAADQAILLVAIDHLRAGAANGTLNPSDLALVKALVVTAMMGGGRGNSSGSSTSVPTAPPSTPPSSTVPGEAPDGEEEGEASGRKRGRGHDAVERAIAAVTESSLPDALKLQILDTLNRAKATLEDPSLTPDEAARQVRDLVKAERSQRLQKAAERLARYSTKVGEVAAKAAALPGSADVVATATAQVAEANALLAGPIDLATVKAAWKLLHDARRSLQQFIEASAASTTTAAPETTVAATTTAAPETTVAPATTAAPETTVVPVVESSSEG